jgi:protein TonB
METPAERPLDPELPLEVRPESPATSPSATPRPIRIGGAVAPPKKIKDVKPIYPVELTGAVVQGVVIIDATIGTDGLVREAKVRRSAPAFDQAALAAVSQWVYTPGRLNGVPTDVTMTVSVVFGE